MPLPIAATPLKLFMSATLLALVACATNEADDTPESQGDPMSAEEARAAEPGTAGQDSAGISASRQALFGSNSCQNADIRIVNSRDYPLTVRSIDYYNGSEGRWQHEDLDNKLVAPGAMEFWTPNFSDTKNDLIYSFDVNFDHDEDADGDPIATHAHDHHINVPDTRCNTGVVYLLDIL